MPITDAWLKANHGKQRDSVIEKADRDSMSARVSAKGKIIFQLRFRIGGKLNRVDIGTYPLMGLKEAREKASGYRAELAKGIDPRIVKRLEIEKNMSVDLLESLYRKWHDSYCLENKKLAHEILRSFEIHIFPVLGMLPVDKISTDRWMTLIESIKQESPAIAERILINAKQMLSWAKRRNLIDNHQLLEITAKRDLSIIKTPGHRSLDDTEIKMLLLALDHSRIAFKNRIFIKLCLIYGCRNGELRVATKQNFDFVSGIWTVPPTDHKTGLKTKQPLIRPIIEETRELIVQAMALSDSEYLFNNEGSSEPMGRRAPLSIPYNLRQWLRKNHQYEMAHWSVHDLRKTARTNFSTLTQPHIAEIMLGHSLPGEWRTYDHHHYLDEQAECLKKWIERINKIHNA